MKITDFFGSLTEENTVRSVRHGLNLLTDEWAFKVIKSWATDNGLAEELAEQLNPTD